MAPLLSVNLHRLRLFCEVVEQKGFTRAARHLYISQQAISQQVKRLQQDLGLTLFERDGRNVRLTLQGERVYRQARALLDHLDDFERWLAHEAGSACATVSVLCSSTPGGYIVPAVLPAFRARFPDVKVDLRVAKTVTMEHELRRIRHLDFLVFIEELEYPNLDTEPVARDELWLVAHPSHPLARRPGPIRLPDLAGHTLVLRQPPCELARRITERLAAAGVKADITTCDGSIEACRTAVMSGYGLTYISRFAVEEPVRAGVLVRLPVPELEDQRDVYIGRWKGRPLSEPARYLLDLIIARLQGTSLAAPAIA